MYSSRDIFRLGFWINLIIDCSARRGDFASIEGQQAAKLNLRNLDDLELNRFMEDVAVSAALSRGFSNVLIRNRGQFL